MIIKPNWSVPPHVKAYSTTRLDGVSQSPFTSLNLGAHVGDNREAVEQNRMILQQQLCMPQTAEYLEQVHSTKVIELPTLEKNIEADAAYTQHAEQVCLIMTADCLPLLVCNKQGDEVAAIHAGWRGLCDGVIEQTIAKFQSSADSLSVWLGPAIGAQAFQVGAEVREAFCQQDSQANEAFIEDSHNKERFLGNIYQLARQRLAHLGVHQISGGEYCTFSQPELFFSYRRDGKTGRMASLIWFEK